LTHHAPARERFAFVHPLRSRVDNRRLCRIPATDHSKYHAWVRAKVCRDERAVDDQELLKRIAEILTAPPAYGAEAVKVDLPRREFTAPR
jgi:putative transposase